MEERVILSEKEVRHWQDKCKRLEIEATNLRKELREMNKTCKLYESVIENLTIEQ